MHYTDRLPPPEILNDFPNWMFDVSRETRPGCHEETLWCHKKQDKIYDDVDYTAGDIYAPGGEIYPALIGVRGGTSPEKLYVIMPQQTWCMKRYNAGDSENPKQCWRMAIISWPAAEDLPLMEMTNPSLFPLRYCTRLVHYESKDTVRGIIHPDGKEEIWDIDSLWGLDSNASTRPKKKRR